MKTSLKLMTPNELLDGYEREVKRMHYDPCDDMEPGPHSMYEYREYIRAQLQRLQGILEATSHRMFNEDN